MVDQSIICPNCGKSIPLSEAFSTEIKGKLESKYRQEAEQLEIRFRKGLAEKEKEFRERYDQQRAALELQLKKKIEEDLALDKKDLQQQVQEKDKQLQILLDRELSFRKRQRELEDRERTASLEIERRLDEERVKIRQETELRLTDEARLKELEKDKQLNDMRRQIEELKRRSDVSSQQAQGEVLELELEQQLGNRFSRDIIEPVAKGQRGADVIQRVCDEAGAQCGSIIWESKRTKAWSDGWVQKLKDDQRTAKAELAVIVTTVLPKDIRHIGFYDGIWVTDVASVPGLASVLRQGLIELAHARNATVSKNDKMELVYGYLSGNEFRQRVEAIVEAFRTLGEDLESERRAMERIWAKREMQINRIMQGTVGMYGDLQGIIGKALPPVAILELPDKSGA